MADRGETVFQRLDTAIFGKSIPPELVNTPGMRGVPDQVLFSTNSKQEYEQKLTQYKQQKLLSHQWIKAGADNAMESMSNITPVKLMYRDADLMDGSPEIGKALDITVDEVCCYNSDGEMVHIYSKSKRVKSVLEDLFENRLMIHVTLPMIVRSMLKYGNEFQLLNITLNDGILGWRELPVYEMERYENGYGPYSSQFVPTDTSTMKQDEITYVRVGSNEGLPYKSWQIAHFRLLYDSFFLPYGCSLLHKARRAWRMWSMMEDAMLIYRLDKSVERRVFKIFVGAINDQDVQAYVQDIANNFKRTPIIDPQTGQVDLRKGFSDVSSDFFIPVRTENASNPIEILQSGQYSTAMDDIDYMQNKIFAGLGIPKTFLNFQEAQGKGQNLSIMDIRFCRMVNRIQQFVLMELNKIAMIHLYLLGFGDEITNFSLSMNNPSIQIESLELDEWTKRIQLVATALADPGNGIQILSLHYCLKKFMKMSDSEIRDMLNEIRLEKAMAAELASTQAIIKKTGIFDTVDRIYGDFDALNSDTPPQPQGEDEEGLGGGGGGGALGGLGGGLDDLGEPGGDESTDLSGDDMEMDMSEAPDADNGGPNESKYGNKPLITEAGRKNKVKSFTERYLDLLSEAIGDKETYSGTSEMTSLSESTVKSIDTILEKMESIIDENNDLLK